MLNTPKVCGELKKLLSIFIRENYPFYFSWNLFEVLKPRSRFLSFHGTLYWLRPQLLSPLKLFEYSYTQTS